MRRPTLRSSAVAILVLVGVLTSAGGICAAENPFILPGWHTNPDEAARVLGPPDFEAEAFVIYTTTVPTIEANLSADLTLWFQSGRLEFASYAFTAADSIDGIMTDFRSVSALLHDLYGEPASRSEEELQFITEVWLTPTASIEHTTIVRRLEHTITFTPPEDHVE